MQKGRHLCIWRDSANILYTTDEKDPEMKGRLRERVR